MKIKEFFRPTKGKIILTVVIFLVLLIVLGLPSILQTKCLPCPPEIINCKSCGAFIEFAGTKLFGNPFLILNVSKVGGPILLLILITIPLLEIIISYLLSCLIISIFKKCKNKKGFEKNMKMKPKYYILIITTFLEKVLKQNA